jgi:hypothetical protein
VSGYSVLTPNIAGWVVTKLKAGLAASAQPYAASVQVGTKKPTPMPDRFVWVRDDSGPVEVTQQRSRVGLNFYAAQRVVSGKTIETDSQDLGRLCLAILSGAADGLPVTLVDQITGPYEIDDDPPLTSGNKNLNHHYGALRITAKGTAF